MRTEPARILGALGQAQEAARRYDAFLALWRESDPGLRPLMDQATEERAALLEHSK